MDHELVGMLGFDAVLSQHGGGKVLQVLGHDDVRLTPNGCGQDVAVIGIGQRERGNQFLEIRHQRIGNMGVPVGSCCRQLLSRDDLEYRAFTSDTVAAMDLGALGNNGSYGFALNDSGRVTGADGSVARG